MPKPILYRPEIDGLRAIAVSLVVLFHLWPLALPGGFIGVDVFFVISGFLITSIINKELQIGSFNFAAFYARRMKRILPVFFVMIAASSLMAYFVLLPTDYIFYARSAMRASVYLSNKFFLENSNYFGLDAQEYPLLHTWSLAVEEQYYLFWPLLMLGFTKLDKLWRNAQVIIICALFILSYGFSIYCGKHHPELGYYSLFSRAFELMLGSVLALLIVKDANYHWHNTNSVAPKVSWALSLIGLSLIIGSAYYLDDKVPFPGWVAILPTIGAGLLIYAGHLTHKNIINHILATRLMVWIGLISYSIYLWHWPILAFWHYCNPGQAISLGGGVIIIALTLVAAILSYRLIELPLKRRQLRFKPVLLIFQLLPLILVVTSAELIIKSQGDVARVKDKLAVELMYLSDKYCYDKVVGNCVFGNQAQQPTKILLFGDSHAGALAPFWSLVAKNYGLSIKELAVGACYPLVDSVEHLPSTEPKLYAPDLCQQQVKYITQHLNDYDVVILSGVWTDYLENKRKFRLDFRQEVKNTLALLQRMHKQVILVSDVPFAKNHAISREIRRSLQPWSRLYTPESLVMDSNNVANQQMQQLAAAYANTYYFDVNANIIAGMKDFPYYDGILLYKDDTHLNEYGSQVLANEFLHSVAAAKLRHLLRAE